MKSPLLFRLLKYQTILIIGLLLLLQIGWTGWTAFDSTPPEICDNGIDDDADGLVDCFDPDCGCTAACEDHYYNSCETECSFFPACDVFEVDSFWISETNVGNYPVLVAGDIDGDGIPEVVTYQINGDTILIINGQDGSSEILIASPTVFDGGMAPAIGDIDEDGFGEILVVGRDRFIYCYEHTGELKYATSDTVGFSLGSRWSAISLADVNYDGDVEIIIGNQVYDALTGSLLVSGGSDTSAGSHPARYNPPNTKSFLLSVAVDVLPDEYCEDCEGLEIVAGNQVFAINIDENRFTIANSLPDPFKDGFTSIADFDMDGDLDAVVQGKIDTQNHVYIWDIQTTEIMRQFSLFSNVGGGASRPNIADIDGDGMLEITFISRFNFYALDNDFSLLWSHEIFDPSAITVSTVFDFCGNGAVDVIYRDQDFLYIYDGPTGDIKLQIPCRSATHIENPIIMDVDADGQTEILITCGPSATQGRVIALKSGGSPWQSTRKVWNQHAYFATNVNDDLSIPIQQQNTHLVGNGLLMNTFLNQFSDPNAPVPDASISISVQSCPSEDSVTLQLEICNSEKRVLSNTTPIQIYTQNPTIINTAPVASFTVSQNLRRDSCTTVLTTLPTPASGTFFAVVNDDFSISTPYNLSTDFPITSISECDFLNNIDQLTVPSQQIQTIVDTSICEDASLTVAGIELFPDNSSTITFTSILNCDSIVQFNISTITPLLITENYTICEGDSISVFGNFETMPGLYSSGDLPLSGCDTLTEITLELYNPIQLQTTFTQSCPDESTGNASVTAGGGTPPYSYRWNTGSTTSNLSMISSGFYSITVTDSLGCTKMVNITIPEVTTEFPVIIRTPITCFGDQDGAVFLETENEELSFSLDGEVFQTDPNFNELGEGRYTVFIMDSFGCQFEEEVYLENPRPINVTLPESATVLLGDSLIINPFVIADEIDSLRYNWQTTLSINCTTCPQVTTFPEFSEDVFLQIMDKNGCIDSALMTINVIKNRNVFIPNAFSPNADGQNDIFMIYTDQSVEKIEAFAIFNRWGAQVFYNENFLPNDPRQGWNGQFKGQSVNPGVYTFYAKILFEDGQAILEKGDVSILK